MNTRMRTQSSIQRVRVRSREAGPGQQLTIMLRGADEICSRILGAINDMKTDHTIDTFDH